jgi:uncharacterized protein (TIGR00297 family)
VSLPLLLAIGLALNAAAAFAAWHRGSVDVGGAVTGAVIATLIFGFGGPLFWLVLMTFFVTSTAAGLAGRREKEWLSAIHQKGERRDFVQVLANGGIGAVAALLWHVTGSAAWAAAFAVSFAASNADTWASEIGVLSRQLPLSPLTFRPLPRGISGGMTGLGTLASAAGALLIGLVCALENLALNILPTALPLVVLLVTAGGFLGAFVDSLLGATLQARYESRAAPGTITERPADGPAGPNRLIHGLRFVTNDVVNIASGVIAAGAAFGACLLLF